jgi:hypothetical protein
MINSWDVMFDISGRNLTVPFDRALMRIARLVPRQHSQQEEMEEEWCNKRGEKTDAVKRTKVEAGNQGEVGEGRRKEATEKPKGQDDKK